MRLVNECFDSVKKDYFKFLNKEKISRKSKTQNSSITSPTRSHRFEVQWRDLTPYFNRTTSSPPPSGGFPRLKSPPEFSGKSYDRVFLLPGEISGAHARESKPAWTFKENFHIFSNLNVHPLTSAGLTAQDFGAFRAELVIFRQPAGGRRTIPLVHRVVICLGINNDSGWW